VVDERLGFPITDPHGSTIPQRDASFALLSEMAVGESGMILSTQPDEGVRLKLWDAGISAGQPFTRADGDRTDRVYLQSTRGNYNLEAALASRVRVRRIQS